MCGISGFYHPQYKASDYLEKIQFMKKTLRHRGPDAEDYFLTDHCGLSHTRLSIRDVSGGSQPMTRSFHGRTATIVYNGELYNVQELKYRLLPFSIHYETSSDTEVLLYCYLVFGPRIFNELNGIFAFAIYENEKIILCRDHIGVKPLFYYYQNNLLVFASEIKGIFAFGIPSKLNRESWCEIIGLGPAHTLGNGVFQDIYEVLPGHYLEISGENLKDSCYWKLKGIEHQEDYETTVDHCSYLIEDSIQRQMVSDIPICTFLSGGLDSSLVTAIVAKNMGEKTLSTFSFDFIDNDVNFKSNTFQSTQDRPYVDLMVKHLGTNHQYLYCNNQNQIDCLYQCVDARDYPCMADVEASMLYFCKIVSKDCRVTLTGECADEIFGGYPWFHQETMLHTTTFPWSGDLTTRTMLFRKDFIEMLSLEDYVQSKYKESVSECPMIESESILEANRRKIFWLNIRWFMMTLLHRMDRCSMYSGLEARVPYADYRILEYVFNIPWSFKCHRGQPKSLLVECGKKYLPPEILFRKKSPYPKTYDPGYEQMLGSMLLKELEIHSPICDILDLDATRKFIFAVKDYGKPWYGQLMAGPQMLAYLLQINYWLKKYQLSVSGSFN